MCGHMKFILSVDQDVNFIFQSICISKHVYQYCSIYYIKN